MNVRPTYLDNEFRQIFRNLSIPDRTLGLQPEQWVKYAKKSGATTMFMDFRSQFYANHPSDFIPKDPVLGDRDLAEEFASACRKHRMKYGAYIPACCVREPGARPRRLAAAHARRRQGGPQLGILADDLLLQYRVRRVCTPTTLPRWPASTRCTPSTSTA